MKTEILFEDQEVLVVYKPAGIATQVAGLMQADVVSELKNYLMLTNKNNADNKQKERREPYLGLVHRLDQPVEGVLVFAKTPRAAAALSRQITDRTLKKEYLAAVLLEDEREVREINKLPSEKITLTDYLVKDGKANISKIGKQSDKNAKKAVLSYQIVKTEKANKKNEQNGTDAEVIAILKIRLETGRHHQIRVQLANANMPLLGDLKYGSEKSQNLSKELGIKDVSLCAHRLSFYHPKTGKKEEFTVSPQKPVLRDFAG